MSPHHAGLPEFNTCIADFWQQHQAELLRFLRARTGNADHAADLLQDLFLRVRAHAGTFCSMENPRAWLYRAARNALIDEYRQTRDHAEWRDDEAPCSEPSPDAIATLAVCIPEILQALPDDVRWLIDEFDLKRRPQQVLAEELGISLSALKSRLLRARTQLKVMMIERCEIEADDTSVVCCHKKMR